jgi:hypothetical protein
VSTDSHDDFHGEERRLTINVETPGKDRFVLDVSKTTCKVISEIIKPFVLWVVAPIVVTAISLRPWVKVDQVCLSPSKADIVNRK